MLSTTELLVEHIISGILSLVWILGFIFCIVGLDLNIFHFIKEYWVIFAIVVTAIAYPIGIIIDTFADKRLDKTNDRIKSKYNLDEHFSMIKLIHKMNDENVRSYFTYNRFKTRVARSSMVNFGMIGLSIPLFIFIRGHEIGIEHPLKIGLTVFITFSLLSITLFYLWKEVSQTTYMRASNLCQEFLK